MYRYSSLSIVENDCISLVATLGISCLRLIYCSCLYRLWQLAVDDCGVSLPLTGGCGYVSSVLLLVDNGLG
jgi:hypothetical protein